MVFAALAEFERDLIRERTQAGLAAARARGRVGGRPTVWTPEKLAAARAMRESGQHDVTAISRALGVSRASVYRAMAGREYDPGHGRRRDRVRRSVPAEVRPGRDCRP
ncbi:MAG TPA: recombinase family protein [Candidatus Nanopelagicales bacterium]